MLKYSQKTGNLYKDDLLLGTGYSGHGQGLNNPKLQMTHNIGPIPCGVWKIGEFFNDKHLGPTVASLKPTDQGVFGRSGFYIHGDNSRMNHTASDGCIILSKVLREYIRDSGETEIAVEI